MSISITFLKKTFCVLFYYSSNNHGKSEVSAHIWKPTVHVLTQVFVAGSEVPALGDLEH